MSIHEHVQQVLSARQDGEVEPELLFLAEDHLARCARCQEAAAAFARVDELAREALMPAGAAAFEAALARRLAAAPVPLAAPSRNGRAPAPAPARTAPRRRRRAALAAAAAALLALGVAAGSLAGLGVLPVPAPGTTLPAASTPATRGPDRVLLARAVLTRAVEATGNIETLQGRFTRSGGEGRHELAGTYRFVFEHPDRVRVEGEGGAFLELLINDGQRAIQVRDTREGPPTVTLGVPLAPPQGADALAPLADAAALWSRARLERGDQPAAVEWRGGRRVYVLVLERERDVLTGAAGPAPVTHYEVWVDAATYLPVRVQYQDRSRPGAPVVREEVRYAYERVNEPVPGSAFTVPSGAEPLEDQGFQPLPLNVARARASYPVPVVRALPEPGWQLVRSGFAPRGLPTGAEAGNPPGQDLVVAVYGSGLERLVVTTLLVPEGALPGGAPYGDPFGAEGVLRATREHRLRAGAYAGTTAHLGLPSDGPPYLWFRTGEGVVVTLSGAATAGELVAAAESLAIPR